MPNRNTFRQLAATAGVHFPGAMDFLPAGMKHNFDMALDAQPGLITVSNAGIPAYLSNYMEPSVIEVLLAPMNAAKIVGETKKGDWTTLTATFPMIESTGEVSSYGDYSNNGSSGANANFLQRESYQYQTTIKYGDRELEMAGLAKLDWASRNQIAAALTLNKFQNKTYFFGVSGLKNYGLLNDPALSASLTPTAAWNLAGTTGEVIYEDIRRIFVQLQTQAGGTVTMDDAMVLAMSPTIQPALAKTNTYKVNVKDLLKLNFPNLRIETAPEYATASGELVQLIVESTEGQKTAGACFTEKLRSHGIVRGLSDFTEKRSQGTWGAVIYRPFAIASMVGV